MGLTYRSKADPADIFDVNTSGAPICSGKSIGPPAQICIQISIMNVTGTSRRAPYEATADQARAMAGAIRQLTIVKLAEDMRRSPSGASPPWNSPNS